MKTLPIILIVYTALGLWSCLENSNNNNFSFGAITEINCPSVEGGEPNLFVSETGQVYLSWVEYLNDTTDALLFSKLESGGWTNPVRIASGTDWFVNWADFPSLVAYKDDGNSLAAHWLQKSARGTYDYDVHVAQSLDGGKNWSPSFIPHTDSISAEHGFVCMLPLSKERIFATWLDGRNTKGDGHEGEGHGHHGSMTLRAAEFDRDGNLFEEAELDPRICDCCQTSAAFTDDGIIVAYRDRSEKEIRDISIVRRLNGKWTDPKTVAEDNWLIAGCPVNGPALAANGKKVAIAWFTMEGEKPQVKVAFSEDSGANFGPPIQIDEGSPLGRVDVVLIDAEKALVSWLEKTDEEAAIKIVKVHSVGRVGESIELTKSNASRQNGFPRMEKNGKQIIFAWTEADSLTKVKTSIIDLE